MLVSLFENNNNMAFVMKHVGRSFILQALTKNDLYIFANEYSNVGWKSLYDAHEANTQDIVNEIIPTLYQEVWDYVSKFDPSPKKKFMMWIIKTYASGGIRYIEDLGRTKEALEIFMDMSNRRVFRNNEELKKYADINMFKTLPDLEKLIREIQSDGSGENSATKIFYAKVADYEKSGLIKVVLNNDEYLVIELKLGAAEASADLFKTSVGWCTARDGSNNYNQYASKGPLYPIYNKKTGSLMQAHFETNSFLDKNDEPVEHEDLPVDVLEYLYDLKSRDDTFISYASRYIKSVIWEYGIQGRLSDEDIDVLARQDIRYSILYDDVTPSRLAKAARNASGSAHKYIIQKHNDKLNDEIIENMVYGNHKTYFMIDTPSQHINRVVLDKAIVEISDIPNVDDELIDWIITDNPDVFRRCFGNSPDIFNSNHVMRAMRSNIFTYRHVVYPSMRSKTHRENLHTYHEYAINKDINTFIEYMTTQISDGRRDGNNFDSMYPQETLTLVRNKVRDSAGKDVGKYFKEFMTDIISNNTYLEKFDFDDTELDIMFDYLVEDSTKHPFSSPIQRIDITKTDGEEDTGFFNKRYGHLNAYELHDKLKDTLITDAILFMEDLFGIILMMVGGLSKTKIKELKKYINEYIDEFENTIKQSKGTIMVSAKQTRLNFYYEYADRDIDDLVEIVSRNSRIQYNHYNSREFINKNKKMMQAGGELGRFMASLINQPNKVVTS